MPRNNLTTPHRAAMVARRILEGGAIASSVEQIGGVRPSIESENYIRAAAAHMGPDVLEAAARIQASYDENQARRQEQAAGVQGEPAPADAAALEHHEDEVVDFGQNAEDAALNIATAAIVRHEPRQTAVGEPRTDQTWHRFTSLAVNRTQRNYMQNAATGLFRAFPCFGEIASREGNGAASRLKTVLRIQPQRHDPQMQRLGQLAPAIRHQMNYNAEDELEVVGRWIRDNALVLSSSSVRFPDLLPNYAPKIMFAVSENETFLLVEENIGVADYSFEERTGDISVTVKPNKTINNGDTLKIFNCYGQEEALRQSHGFVDFNEGSNLSIIRVDASRLALIYTGDRTLNGGDRLYGRLEAPDDVYDQALKASISGQLEPVGVLDAGKGGTAPVDGKYIYSWPGGRQYYQAHPEKLAELVDMMTARESIEFTMDAAGLPRKAPTRPALAASRPRPAQATRAVVAPQPEAPAAEQSAAPTPEVNEPEAPVERPSITPARARRARPSSKPTKALAVLRSDMGFALASTPKDGQEQPVKAAVKTCDDGSVLVITAADGNALPLAKSFVIEHRSNLQDPGQEIGRFEDGIPKDDIETAIADAVSQLSGPRP